MSVFGAWGLAPLLGMLVGLVLALTGAGGAILAVPLLLFGLHLKLAQAAPIGLLAVALAAAAGAFLAWRARTLRYRAAALMAVCGIAAAPVGQAWAQVLPERPLTLVFALVLAAAAGRTLVQASRELRGDTAQRPAHGPCHLGQASGRLEWNAPCAAALALTGAGTGLLSGLLGVGGGFVLVPALLVLTDLPMKAVIATSMGVIALVSAGAALNAAWQGQLLWQIGLPFALGALAGLLAGRLFAERVRGPRLQQGFGVLSLLVAAGLVLRASL
ncbi:sulfite exporter TauE/SafE family protein [Ramlibacter sp. XY19]|uniref:sulfite exporter TauE/SafE family protein n=1 Tax=Ramlibacter paludis TaxID=2908000 RepID=UPI0023DA9A7B|nr:sulfite exporter TauE/SafE family protein [Ramlibacter paludis]MCG2592515.1 sulfite exporter TauE/SafE family protein [Ramlibacter paludis]